jgi:hypothetical protein
MPGTGRGRSGHAEAAAFERALAELPPGGGVQIVGARPADVATAVALAGVRMALMSGDDDAPRTTGKAFDPKRLHHGGVGRCELQSNPSFEGRPEKA